MRIVLANSWKFGPNILIFRNIYETGSDNTDETTPILSTILLVFFHVVKLKIYKLLTPTNYRSLDATQIEASFNATMK